MAEGRDSIAFAFGANAASAIARFSPSLAITLDREILGRRLEREPLALEDMVLAADDLFKGIMKSIMD